VRSAAVDVVLACGVARVAEHAAAIAQRLEHPKPAVRTAALSLLAVIPMTSLQAFVPAIIKALKDSNANRLVRHASLTVLQSLEEVMLAPHAQEIAKHVEDPDDDVRAAAYAALYKADPTGRLVTISPSIHSPSRRKSQGSNHPSPAARLMGARRSGEASASCPSALLHGNSSFRGLELPPHVSVGSTTAAAKASPGVGPHALPTLSLSAATPPPMPLSTGQHSNLGDLSNLPLQRAG